MAKNQIISTIGVDSATDNGKVPVYNSTTKVFDMTTPSGGSPTVKNGVATYAIATASGTQTIAHGLGSVPKYVKLDVTLWNNNTGVLYFSFGTYNGTTNSSIYGSTSFGAGNSSTNGVSMYVTSTSSGATGVITVDSTNITITWTKVGTPDAATANILWSVF